MMPRTKYVAPNTADGDRKFTSYFSSKSLVLKRLSRLLVAVVVGMSLWPMVGGAANRAFVVGIDRYDYFEKDRQLDNAVSDATAIANKFEEIKFDAVTLVENPTRSEFNRAWQDFLETLDVGDNVAFYFSGHGIAIDGKNYLLPRSVPSVESGRSELIQSESISLNNLQRDVGRREPAINLMILDACRNDPFEAGAKARGGETRGGLAGSNDPPSGTFIMYSAAAGMVALDSVPGMDTKHSVYTHHLLDLMTRRDLHVANMARELRKQVNATTKREANGFLQSPAYYDGLVVDFCLPGCGTELPMTATSTQTPQFSTVLADDVPVTGDDESRLQNTNGNEDGNSTIAAARPRSKVPLQDQSEAAVARKRGQDVFWSDTEKALKEYRRAAALDPNNPEGFLYLGDLLMRSDDIDSAHSAYQSLQSLAQTSEEPKWQAIAFARIGDVHHAVGDLEQAERHYLEAIEAESEPMLTAKTRSSLGSVYLTRGDIPRAEENYIKSLALFKELDAKEDLAAQYGRLGTIYRYYGKYDKSEEYHLRSLKMQRRLGHEDRAAGQYANLALLYRDRGDVDASEEFHLKSLKIYERLNDRGLSASQYGYLGILYEARGDFDEAEAYLQKSLSLFEQIGRLGDVAERYRDLAYVYQQRGDYVASERLYRDALDTYSGLDRKDGMAEVYGSLGKLSKRRGDLELAREHWRRGRALYEELGLSQKANKFSAWLAGLE